MSGINNGGPAFPQPIDDCGFSADAWDDGRGGMSLRDWFAGQALIQVSRPFLDNWVHVCGEDSSPSPHQALDEAAEACGQDDYDVIARAAYTLADAMISERGEE